jgi:hypothetical protein
MECFVHGKLLAEKPKTPTSTSQLINAKLEEHRIQQCHGCGHKIEREKVSLYSFSLFNLLPYFINFEGTSICGLWLALAM